MGIDRDELGRIARHAWIEWAKKQDFQVADLAPWNDLDEPGKEANRQIAQAVAEQVLLDQKIYREMLEEVEQYIKKHEEFNKVSGYGSRTERIGRLLNQYRSAEAEMSRTLANFKQDVQVFLKSFALVIDSAANASTHAEKNARLRGAIELVESAVSKLRDNFEHFAVGWSRNPDIFRSDYPVRKYVDRIRELEVRLAKLEGTDEKPQEQTEYDTIPF